MPDPTPVDREWNAPDWGRILTRDILPWWDEHGADDDHGGVLTCFDNSGVLVSSEKYTWSQGRWAWMCAEIAEEARAGRLDLDADVWERRACSTADFIAQHAVLADRRTAFRTTATGEVLTDADGEAATSVFADLFAALGLGAAHRILGDKTDAERGWLRLAVEILESAHTRVSDRTARTEPYPVPAGYEAMAGWMNLLHTAAELLRAVSPDDKELRERVIRVRNASLTPLLGGRESAGLISYGTGCIADWQELRPDDPADQDTLLARHRTPGHLLELLWMLVRALDTGSVRHPLLPDDPALESLALRALTIGADAEHGGLLRYVDREGGPPRGRAGRAPYEELVRSTWDTKLWWVQVEALLATALLADRMGGPELRAWHERLARWTLETFPDVEQGEWIQIRARDGSPLDQVVALPVKDPFHIARALLLTNRINRPNPDEPAENDPQTRGFRS